MLGLGFGLGYLVFGVMCFARVGGLMWWLDCDSGCLVVFSYAEVLAVFVAGGFAGLLAGLGCCGFGFVCGFAVWFWFGYLVVWLAGLRWFGGLL